MQELTISTLSVVQFKVFKDQVSQAECLVRSGLNDVAQSFLTDVYYSLVYSVQV